MVYHVRLLPSASDCCTRNSKRLKSILISLRSISRNDPPRLPANKDVFYVKTYYIIKYNSVSSFEICSALFDKLLVLSYLAFVNFQSTYPFEMEAH
jgi:hypothetical protein